MQVIGGEVPSAVSVADFKRATHFSGGDQDDDLSLAAYLMAAQEVVETASGRPIGARSVRFEVPIQAGCLRWWFPVAPVSALSKVQGLIGGAWADLDVSAARVEFGHDEPQFVMSTGFLSAGQTAIAVEATVGIDGGAREKALKQAVILIAKSWFEAGIAVEDFSEAKMSFGAKALIKQARYKRPCIWRAA
ncbi:head-tail connector protein [Celeribacter naphthalenivorans]|uniref:hypothetical protein n=1 Tax=Celeribacter naphthalenivorans TaxID=1614694 RepID=UPI001CFBA317|nr:hypothetical protein [Celeribacter naphthalenivorans]